MSADAVKLEVFLEARPKSLDPKLIWDEES